MKSDLDASLLRQINADLESRTRANTPANPTVLSAVQSQNSAPPLVVPETPQEFAKVKSALAVLSADVPRGNGALFTPGTLDPTPDYWLLVIWAIASLGWANGKELARTWSVTSARYTNEGFEDAWKSFDASRGNRIGIGSLYKLASHHGWQPPSFLSPDAEADTGRFTLLSASDVLARPPQVWRVKHLLPDQGLAAIFGPSGSGKSFLALDLAACIADGHPWFGIKTLPSPVVYIMLEGEGGLRNRIAAHEKARGAPLAKSFRVVLDTFSLITGGDVAELAAVVPAGAVIFIDTLNRAAPTVDENSSKEMGQILQGAKELQAQTGSLVVMIHHTGKDPTRGLRGHSSLLAALDAAIEVERSANDSRSWAVAKAKDGEDGKRTPFKLVRHVLAVDADGDEISSCSVEPDISAIFVRPAPQGKHQRIALKVMKEAISSPQCTTTGIAGCPSGTKCMKFEDAVSVVAGALPVTAPNRRKTVARGVLEALTVSSHLVAGIDAADEAWCWLG